MTQSGYRKWQGIQKINVTDWFIQSRSGLNFEQSTPTRRGFVYPCDDRNGHVDRGSRQTEAPRHLERPTLRSLTLKGNRRLYRQFPRFQLSLFLPTSVWRSRMTRGMNVFCFDELLSATHPRCFRASSCLYTTSLTRWWCCRQYLLVQRVH